MYGFTIQIYCDFSGYTDIAIGLAKILRIAPKLIRKYTSTFFIALSIYLMLYLKCC